MVKEVISTTNAPGAIGPYSQGIKFGNLMFVSGQTPLNPATMKIAEGDVQCQAKQCLENIKGILESAGTNLDNVLKTTVFIKDMNSFSKINEIYAQYFTKNQPARSCVEVARLPMDVLVEIEVIAYIP
ncbi:2-iminobutanoate/2-iminopropanoate deaminase [bioreactor metagenome]|uniref:2-iminobutanoate/2-iminopropanoate deaminase n=1 Tax=bioreactor metagenome TaxID=1076179 RepID=A0A645CP73_9ZZZZ|nr:RidA family protein [Lutispora sp.]MEA4963116.1 RidA family protein [Lutispora sp.]HCJ58242.1 reactive intermediate/imine deaminase [Clostridiaceae bacterium]